jgi:hypothetical protein
MKLKAEHKEDLYRRSTEKTAKRILNHRDTEAQRRMISRFKKS